MKHAQEEKIKVLDPGLLKKWIVTLQRGGVISFPTETVYALAGDANNILAIKRIFKLKNRPLHQPLSVLLAKNYDLSAWADEIPSIANQLADYFWPGPLTLILKKKASVLSELTGGQAQIGLRVPNHPVAQTLLKAWGGGLAAPSANRSTYLSPTHAEHVKQEFGDKVTIIDGGGCSIGIESTVVDVTTTIPRLLRVGAISQEAIERVINRKVINNSSTVTSGIRLSLQQIAADQLKNSIFNYLNQGRSIAVLARHPAQLGHENLIWINMPAYATDYARVLYRHLHELEQNLVGTVLIESTPDSEEWHGIRCIIEKYK